MVYGDEGFFIVVAFPGLSASICNNPGQHSNTEAASLKEEIEQVLLAKNPTFTDTGVAASDGFPPTSGTLSAQRLPATKIKLIQVIKN